jgi:hypothetical protein
MLFDLARAHPGVVIHFRVGMETGPLLFAGALDAFADGSRRFFGAGAGDVAIFDGGNFDVEIDAVEQRSGNPLAITVDLRRSAAAFAFQVAEVTARTWIHGGDEHELGWERDAASPRMRR